MRCEVDEELTHTQYTSLLMLALVLQTVKHATCDDECHGSQCHGPALVLVI